MSKESKIYISEAFAEGKIDRKLRMCEAVARILSEKYGVNVIFSPDGECSTNTERMLLPYDKGVDEALILGLCGHETGHLKGTDFTVKRLITRNKKVYNRALLFCVVNALEDVRIENLMEEAYPGFKDLFKRMIPYIQDKKQPVIEREERRRGMIKAGMDPDKVQFILDKEKEEEIEKLKKELEEAGLSKAYISAEVEKMEQMYDASVPEIQKILDVIYLMLRDYDYTWYSPETVEYVKREVLDTAKKVFECKNTIDVLAVAEEVYFIITKNDERVKKELNKETSKGKGKKEGKGKEGEGPGKEKGGKPGGGSEPGPKKEAGPKKEGGSGGKESEEEGEGKDPKGSDEGKRVIRIGPNKVLRVGSRIRHLENSDKLGVVTAIDNDKQEVEVEWD